MVKVFIALLVSLLSGPIVNSYFFDTFLYDQSYKLYVVAIAFVYLLSASLCLFLAILSLNKKQNFKCILIGVLCLCMVVTAMFNLVMVIDGAYAALNDIKSGPGLSWRTIYSSVEIIITLIVGGNGLNYMANVGVCHFSKRNATIRRDPNSYKSKQQ